MIHQEHYSLIEFIIRDNTNKKLVIEYGVHSTIFGTCFIANSKFGLCAIEFIVNIEDDFLHTFSQNWKNIELKHSQENTQHIADLIENKNPISLKVLTQSSTFQQTVWAALSSIPYGETRTYKEIAILIEKPSAFRAVANAIGKNSIAILIPCHRVISSSGRIGGYKWGINIKEKLLNYEQSVL